MDKFTSILIPLNWLIKICRPDSWTLLLIGNFKFGISLLDWMQISNEGGIRIIIWIVLQYTLCYNTSIAAEHENNSVVYNSCIISSITHIINIWRWVLICYRTHSTSRFSVIVSHWDSVPFWYYFSWINII